jgi:hypothetical protein
VRGSVDRPSTESGGGGGSERERKETEPENATDLDNHRWA